MRKYQNYTPRTKKEILLAEAFLKLKTSQDILNFMRDIMTAEELEALSSRLEMARLLHEGKLSYREIAEKTNASTTTVSRVAQWLKEGYGGYITVLKK